MRIIPLRLTSAMLPLVLLAATFFSLSCASQQSNQSAAVGAGLGALAGALIDEDNRWRGAVIGGLIGGALGGALSEIQQQAAREAVAEGRPVVYESKDGYRRVEAVPYGYDAETNCHKVRNRVWEDGRLVKDEVTEVCESRKTQPGYDY